MLTLRILAHDLASPRLVVLLPLASVRVQAGFPSPADDHSESRIDLNQAFVRRPVATFLIQVEGRSMQGGQADIRPGDILVVDRSLEPKDGSLVVAILGGDFTLKRLRRQGGRWVLVPENTDYPVIILSEDLEVSVWGVVTARVSSFDKR